MDILIVFKFLQSLIVIALLFFILDIRATRRQFIKSRIPLFMGVIFSFYVLGYFLTLFIFPESVTVFDWLALILTVLGLSLVLKARFDLREFYAWPGFLRPDAKIVKTGIYSYIRHPIYVGIYIFVIGTLLTVVYHSVFIVGLMVVMLAALLLASITVTARYEERALEDHFGDVYVIYKKRVHAVFPFKGRSYENEE